MDMAAKFPFQRLPLFHDSLLFRMQTTTVYLLQLIPGQGFKHEDLKSKLNEWTNKITKDDIKAELVQFYKDCNEEQVAQWLQVSKIEASESKDVPRAVMGSMRVTSYNKQTVKLITRAHQRLMLKHAHHDDFDLSIN